jgi:hypothetical protein
MTKFLESNALVVILLIALVVVSVLVLNYAFQPTMDGIEWQETTYRVQSGDSLWAIAGEYCPDGVDRREWIDEIRALNDLPDSIIYEGQKLTVLAPVKEG